MSHGVGEIVSLYPSNRYATAAAAFGFLRPHTLLHVDHPYQPQDLELIVNTPDVRVAEITLAPHTDTPPHKHTAVPEVCYCLEGELTCATEGESPTIVRAG